jgi:hydrogenase expression/formation protein HypE
LEMSLALKLGFELYADQVPLDESTKEICSKLRIDPLKLIGSGSLLVSCQEGDSESIADKIRSEGIPCAEIGKFRDLNFGRWLISGGKRMELKGMSVQDELWPALSKYGNFS